MDSQYRRRRISCICYDAETQELFDQLNEEKRDIFFEEHPEREDSWDGDEKIQYDRYAGFLMDARLNEAASHRLEFALENGYSGESIPGEGTLKEYLETVPYRKMRLLRSCISGEERMQRTPFPESWQRHRRGMILQRSGDIPWDITGG